MDSREFYETVEHNIAKAGQHLQFVFPTSNSDDLPFIYTIGNHQRNLPELLIVGGGQAFGGILNHLCEKMRERGRAFDNGELVSLGGAYPVKIVDVPTEICEPFTFQVGRYYQVKDYRVQQVMACDPHGRFPGDPGCQEPYELQAKYLRSKLH